MRPIKLTISAFGPYASKQVIDFEELNGRNIFVISGKTGAGKTTIFDAISYALYGTASGESREIDSLRSHFADDDVETFVELEFDLRNQRYIVSRVPKQKRKKSRGEGYTEKGADATLTLPDGKVITSVKKVTDKLIEILGITKEQFKQIVMLPQGEFKKLLLASSEDRELIFRKIFNTYDFEKIQSELKDKAINLNKNRNKCKHEMEINLKNIKGEHDIFLGEYVDFPFVIEKLKELIQKDNNDYKILDKENTKIYTVLQGKEKEKINIENNNRLLKEKENIEKELMELLYKEETFQNKKNDIANIKNAKEVKYIEDRLIENKKRIVNRELDYKVSLGKIDKLKEEYKLAKEELSVEEAKEYTRDNLKVEIEKLKDIEPKMLEFDTLRNKSLACTKKVEEVKLQINNNKSINENLNKEKIENENTLKLIATLEIDKLTIENDVKNKKSTIQEIRELFKVIATYEGTRTKHINLSKEYSEFEKIYIGAKNKYDIMDELYKKEQAGILANNLKDNAPCPVCGSTKHPNPASIKNDGVIPTKEELKISKDKLEQVEKENNKKINELTILNRDIKNCLDIVNNSLERFSQILNIEKTYSIKTASEVKAKGSELRSIIDKLEEKLEKLNDKIKLKENIVKRNTEVDNNIIQNEKTLNNLIEDEKQCLKDQTEISTKIESYRNEIPENISDVKILKELISIKTKELKQSIDKLSNIRETNEKISKNLEGELSASNEINKSVEVLAIEKNNIKSEYEVELRRRGFEDINIYEKSKSKIDILLDLEKQVEEYTSRLKLAKSRKEDISNKTKNLVIIDLSDIEEQIKNARVNKKEIEEKLKNLYSIIDNNKSILKNVQTLNVEFKEMEEQYKIVGELADLANGKKAPYISFERYILASYFEDIIDAANIRLEKMTGDRFSLIRKKSKSKGAGQKGLELEIYDNYTDSSRDVSSLSGGESFKASLSLALGLSDVVQSNAGGVSLDTMFVDEGFGTLDPQSLDNAIDSLLELQRGGRLVGIISHVEELKERIDAKLEVVATSKGSKAEFSIL